MPGGLESITVPRDSTRDSSAFDSSRISVCGPRLSVAQRRRSTVSKQSAWGQLKFVRTVMRSCRGCGAKIWGAASFCPTCGHDQSERCSDAEPARREKRTLTLDMSAVDRPEIEVDESPGAREADPNACVFCARIIPPASDYCPLDGAREVDGPKLHPECWDAFMADTDAPRCEWCFNIVKVEDNKRDGAFVPKGGAAGQLLGAGRRVLHQWCVDAYNVAKGNSCMHCGKPVQLGLNVEGLGMVHKGFCYDQITKQLALERQAMIAQMTQSEADEYTCVVCGQLISPDAEYFALDDDTDGASTTSRKMHIECWGESHKCVQCGSEVAEEAEYFEVDAGKMVHVECWDAWQEKSAPFCLHCSGRVMGQYYEAGGGVLHLDCYEPWMAAQQADDGDEDRVDREAEAGPSRDAAAGAAGAGAAEPDGDPSPAVESVGAVLEALTCEDEFASTPSFDLGWMWKRGRVRQSWKRRWAVIRCGCLCYFKDREMHSLKGSVELAGCTVRLCEIDGKQTPRGMGSQWGLELAAPKHTMLAFPVGASKQTVRAEAAPWVLNLSEAIEEADLVRRQPERRAEQQKAHAVLSRASMIQVGEEAGNEEDEEED